MPAKAGISTSLASQNGRMSLFEPLKKLWKAYRGKRLSELLTVEWDGTTIRVVVLEQLEASWNQEFRWDDITRVCFKDEGIAKSDLLILRLRDREVSVFIPTEARQGSKFLGQLCERGYFPEKVWRKALGSTSGEMICWPEHHG